ncbi:MAG: hypothetical protein V3R84_03175 [Acidimicrobiia bacterium]
MPLRPLLVALVALASSLAWSLQLILDPAPFASGPAVVLALTMVSLALVAITGLLLARSRWAPWLAVAIAAAQLALAITMPVDWQVVAVVVALSLAALAATIRDKSLQRSSGGPPPLAVVLLLLLVAFPALVAVSNADGISVAAIVGSVFVVLAAVVYGRGGIISLWTMRSLVPLGAVLSAATTPLPPAAAVLAAGAGLTALGWSPVISNAAAPLAPLHSPGYRIPPELAPREILDAAGLDEHGRRQ